jgi:hypothetical protein
MKKHELSPGFFISLYAFDDHIPRTNQADSQRRHRALVVASELAVFLEGIGARFRLLPRPAADDMATDAVTECSCLPSAILKTSGSLMQYPKKKGAGASSLPASRLARMASTRVARSGIVVCDVDERRKVSRFPVGPQVLGEPLGREIDDGIGRRGLQTVGVLIFVDHPVVEPACEVLGEGRLHHHLGR